MKSFLTIVLAFGISSGVLGSVTPAEQAWWNAAVEQFESGHPEQALPLFDRLVRECSEQRRCPRDLHWNLGLSAWAANRFDLAAESILRSGLESAFPFREWNALAKLQDELGVDDITKSPGFMFGYFSRLEILAILAGLGVWCFCAAICLELLGRGGKGFRFALMGGTAAFWILGMAGYVGQTLFFNFGVLRASQEVVKIYTSPTAKQLEKPLELPSGTIVSLGATRKGYVEITDPLAGWVTAAEVIFERARP